MSMLILPRPRGNDDIDCGGATPSVLWRADLGVPGLDLVSGRPGRQNDAAYPMRTRQRDIGVVADGDMTGGQNAGLLLDSPGNIGAVVGTSILWVGTATAFSSTPSVFSRGELSAADNAYEGGGFDLYIGGTAVYLKLHTDNYIEDIVAGIAVTYGRLATIVAEIVSDGVVMFVNGKRSHIITATPPLAETGANVRVSTTNIGARGANGNRYARHAGAGIFTGVLPDHVKRDGRRLFWPENDVIWLDTGAGGGTTSVYSDLDDSASIIAAVASDIVDSASILASVSADLADSASILNSTSSDLADSALILTSVSSDLADSAVILNSVTSDLADSASILSSVSADLADSASILNSTSADLADSALIYTSASGDLADSYDIQASSTVTSDLSDSAAIFNTVSSDLADSSEIRVAVASDLADSAGIFSAVLRDLTDSVTIFNTVTSDLADSVTIYSAVSSDLIDSAAIWAGTGGGGASADEIVAAIWARAALVPLPVDVVKINSAAVLGTGQTSDLWRGA